jgi:hypothetical protein
MMNIFKNNVVKGLVIRTNLLFLLLTCFIKANATTHIVHVADFHFDPVQFDALVGDTVKFVWDNGNHTTTSSAIPAGAATWDEPINSSNTSFIYVITVAGDYTYFCKKHGDQIASFTATGTLPVQLINFSVSNTKNNQAFINWSTATEQNTSFFSVQRSTDAINFNEIAMVNAAGNSSAIKSYSYTDNNISAANKFLYYKLAIADKDGKQIITDVKFFKNNSAAVKLVTALSPNPVSNNCNLNIQFNADKEETMFVQLYNINGILIKQTTLKTVEGLNSQHIYVGNLSAGTYKIIFKLHNITDTKTIIVQ